MSTPAIVLVHGAWHVAQIYDSFVKRLQDAGFDVSCPLLPTCDPKSRSDGTNLQSDVEAVRREVQKFVSAGRDVIMLLHSYGGAVGTEAAKGFSKDERTAKGQQQQSEGGAGVVHLIYMCGFILQVGESVAGVSVPRPDPEHVERDERDGTTFLAQPPRRLFFGDVGDEEVARRSESLLVRQSGAALVDAITYPAWRYIPATYLKTTEDEALLPAWQDRQIKAVRDAGVDLVVKEYKSSHSPYLSVPEEMVRVVKEVAEKMPS